MASVWRDARLVAGFGLVPLAYRFVHQASSTIHHGSPEPPSDNVALVSSGLYSRASSSRQRGGSGTTVWGLGSPRAASLTARSAWLLL